MKRIAIVLSIFLLLGCKEETTESNRNPQTNKSCIEDAKWITNWIDSVYQLNGKIRWGFDDFEELNLGVVENEISVPEKGSFILMNRDSHTFSWTKTSDASQAIVDFGKRKDIFGRKKTDGKVIKLYIDTGTRWTNIVNIINSMRNELPAKIAIVFKKKIEAFPRPPATAYERNLIKRYHNKKLKPGEIILYHGLSSEAEKEFSKCPSMLEMMKASYTQDPSERSVMLNSSLIEAYKKCNCNVSKDILTSTIWRLLFVGTPDDPKQPTVKYLTLASKQATDFVKFKRPKDSIWQDVYKDVLKIDSKKQVVFMSE